MARTKIALSNTAAGEKLDHNDAGGAVSAGPTAPTKRAKLRALLERPEGAMLEALQREFGWQAHTARAAISGLRKAGLNVLREVADGRATYRIAADVST